MDLNVIDQDGKALVEVLGRMDAVTAPEFESLFDDLLAQGETVFVVDLAGLEYISSAGLRAILSSAKKIKAAGGKIGFAGLSGMVREVFDISGFGSMFNIYASVTEALEKL